MATGDNVLAALQRLIDAKIDLVREEMLIDVPGSGYTHEETLPDSYFNARNLVARRENEYRAAAAEFCKVDLDPVLADAMRYRWLRAQMEVTRNIAVPARVGLRDRYLLVELFHEPDNDADFIDAAIDHERQLSNP